MYRKSKHHPWQTYGFLCVSFGDIPAQVFLECCLRKVAKEYSYIDELAALIILLDRFVDDLPSGSDLRSDILRLRGEILESWQTTGTLAAIMKKGGFLLKVIACSGDPNGPMVQKLGGAILGIRWDTESDRLSIPLTVNISPRRRGSPTGPNITLDTINTLEGAVYTQRICLSITMSLYDPLGFIVPLTIRLKWMLQQLSTAEGIKGWDDELSFEQKQPWAQLLSEMVTQGSISFPRSCKPDRVGG
jgi:hypothetical protein